MAFRAAQKLKPFTKFYGAQPPPAAGMDLKQGRMCSHRFQNEKKAEERSIANKDFKND